MLYVDFEDEDDNVFNVVHNGNVQAVRDILEEDFNDEQDTPPAVTHQVCKNVAGKKIRDIT